MILKELVETLLLEIGSTADDIARVLINLQLRGDILQPCSCPLGELIRMKFQVKRYSVSSMGIIVPNADGSDILIEHTPASAAFIQHFDQGEYPELVLASSFD